MSNLAVLDPRAAFVDVGSEKMHVSIAGGPPAVFGTVTSQLHALRDYLAEHQVRCRDGSDRGLLVTALWGSGSCGHGGGHGRWSPNAQSSGAEDRHERLPVGRHAACAWLVAGGLCPAGPYPPSAGLSTPSRGTYRGGRWTCPAHAKSAGADECQIARSHQLSDRGERSGRDPRHPCR